MRIKATCATLLLFSFFLSLPGFCLVQPYLTTGEDTVGQGLAYQNGFAWANYKHIFPARASTLS